MGKVKSLEEVSKELGEPIGKTKKFSVENGYYKVTRREKNNIELEDEKIRTYLRKDNKDVYFKSKRGYNTKYQNKKEYANHYGEYIAYIILKQLGKKACKVELGSMEMNHPYSRKKIEIDGIVSHLQLAQEEMFWPISSIIGMYKTDHHKQYYELAERGKTYSDTNHTNIEILLKSIENYYRKNGQEDKIPSARKDFFDMCIFDIRFANRDRHDDNFGLKFNQLTKEIEYYSLFDNEQILGFQEEKKDVQKYLESESAYQKFKDRELTSYIGIPGNTQKVESQKLLEYLLEHYYDEVISSINDIKQYKLEDLKELMDRCEGLSEEHKKLAETIFEGRRVEFEDTVKKFEMKKRNDEGR